MGLKPRICVLSTEFQQAQLMDPERVLLLRSERAKTLWLIAIWVGEWKEELQGQDFTNLTFSQKSDLQEYEYYTFVSNFVFAISSV